MNYAGIRPRPARLRRRPQPGQAGQVHAGQPHPDPRRSSACATRRPDYVVILPWNLRDEVIAAAGLRPRLGRPVRDGGAGAGDHWMQVAVTGRHRLSSAAMCSRTRAEWLPGRGDLAQGQPPAGAADVGAHGVRARPARASRGRLRAAGPARRADPPGLGRAAELPVAAPFRARAAGAVRVPRSLVQAGPALAGRHRHLLRVRHAVGPAGEHRCETRPANPYGFAKDSLRRQLQLLQRSEPFALGWARLFYMYGDGQASSSLLPPLRRRWPGASASFPMSGGEQLRDYLPVSEVARRSRLARRRAGGGRRAGRGQRLRRPAGLGAALVEGWIRETAGRSSPSWGAFPIPDYEPMAFWGVAPPAARRATGMAEAAGSSGCCGTRGRSRPATAGDRWSSRCWCCSWSRASSTRPTGSSA